LLALLVIPAVAREDKPDPKKGEGEYSINGVKLVRIFNVDEHNAANPDLPTRIEGKIRNISTTNLASVTVHVAFYESDGTRIAVVDDTETNIAPNEVVRFQVDEPEGAHAYHITGLNIIQSQ
jgi:hypothetical protein